MNIKWIDKSFDDLYNKELYQIMRLRQEIFVVEQNCPYLDADGLDEPSRHLYAMDGDLIIAYSRIIPAGIEHPIDYMIGRVVCDEKYRALGIGKELMKRSITLCGQNPIRIHAQNYLYKFYNSLGFEQVGEIYLLDGIDHIEMILSAK
jgi:ElaA protein